MRKTYVYVVGGGVKLRSQRSQRSVRALVVGAVLKMTHQVVVGRVRYEGNCSRKRCRYCVVDIMTFRVSW